MSIELARPDLRGVESGRLRTRPSPPRAAEDGTRQCPCGCGQPVKTPKGFAGRGCSLRAIPREERVARSKRHAERLGKAYFHALASKASRARFYKAQWDDLLEKWLDDDLPPKDALREAYTRGYRSGFNTARRNNRRSQEHWSR